MVAAIARGSPGLVLSLLVYSGGLLAMPVISALYNGDNDKPRRGLLRRLDHAAILVMIAGTYTPFLATKLDGAWSRWLLVYIWAVVGAGAAMKPIWHGFVIAGAACHYAAVLGEIAMPGSFA